MMSLAPVGEDAPLLVLLFLHAPSHFMNLFYVLLKDSGITRGVHRVWTAPDDMLRGQA